MTTEQMRETLTATEALVTPSSTPPPSRRRRVGQRIGVGGVIGRVLVWALVAFNLGLVVWMVLTSFRNSAEYVRNPFALPIPPQVENYVNAWTSGNFGIAFLNSLVVTLIGSTLCVAIAVPAAYALSRSLRRIASPLIGVFVLALGVPGQVILIPVYVALAQAQQASGIALLNSKLGLIIVMVGLNLPFAAFLLTGFFKTLPGELEEAAALDGASAVRTFATVMLPLARSGITTAFILTAISVWNETLFSLVLITEKDERTLPLALMQVLNASSFNGQDWGQIFAGITLMVFPLLVVYMWMGRRIVEGMTVGAGK